MLHEEEIELYQRTECAAGAVLDRLLEKVFRDNQPEEAKRLLKMLADTPEEPLIGALQGYRGMRSSLLARSDLDDRKTRKERLETYRISSELFQLEMKAARQKRLLKLAMSADWSGLSGIVRDTLEIHRCMGMLWLGEWLYRLQIPGSLELCDTAACSMFRMLVQRAAHRNLESAA
jgi:hypothetical protein